MEPENQPTARRAMNVSWAGQADREVAASLPGDPTSWKNHRPSFSSSEPYSTSAPVEELYFSMDQEGTPLLSSHERSQPRILPRSAHGARRTQGPRALTLPDLALKGTSSRTSHGTFSPVPAGSWRKSLIFSKRKSETYDEDDETAATGTGMRVWYQDFTTIDWIHDTIKERVRLRTMRRTPGMRGWLTEKLDGSIAWILLALIGVTCGCIASLIEVSYTHISDWRTGFCGRSIWLRREHCCSSEECPEWSYWSDPVASHMPSRAEQYTQYAIYVISGVVLALLSAVVTKQSRASTASSAQANRTVTEPSWVTNAREQRGLRRSKSREEGLKAGKKPKFHAAGSGIPEVKTILGGFVITGFLGARTLVVKVVGLILSTASGLVVGSQGPLVHISCCVGNVLSRLFNKYAKNEGKRREILSASSAAGVAVAFGAPLGGVLFALEEVSYYFPMKTMWRSFFCALVAAVTVRIINPIGGGRVVRFQVHWENLESRGVWSFWELVPFAAVGILGGLYGAAFIKLTSFWSRVRSRTCLGSWPLAEVFLIALITSTVAYPWELTSLGNNDLLGQLFSQCTESSKDIICHPLPLASHLGMLALALLIKFVLTILAFGIKVPAGIFVPSMCAGALVGRMVGTVVQWTVATYPEHYDGALPTAVVPGLYAVVGAAAAVGGVTRMTISLAVIILELTGSVSSLLPSMLAIMLAKWVGDALSPQALFEKSIIAGGYPYLDSKRPIRSDPGRMLTAMDVMERGVKSRKVIRSDVQYTIEELLGLVGSVSMTNLGPILPTSSTPHGAPPAVHPNGVYEDTGFPIVDHSDVLVGYIAAPELMHALGLVTESLETEHGTRRPSPPIIFHRPGRVPSVSEVSSDRRIDVESFLLTSVRGRSPAGGSRIPRAGWHSPARGSERSIERMPIVASPAATELGPAGISRSNTPDLFRGRSEQLAVQGGGRTSSPSPLRSGLTGSVPGTTAMPMATPASSMSLPLLFQPPSPGMPSTSFPQVTPHSFSISEPSESRDASDNVQDLTRWMDPSPLSVPHTASLDLVYELFVKLGVKTLCVVCDGKLVGLIHKKGIVAYIRGENSAYTPPSM
ncbi:chloride channel [Fimicolochytrium jonesii]|uniref:chloride channel n=1 Tax=Fimicolochytrium jonesii TaxID=1396493 RepID=UPI0022FDC5B4|nr:chloride channel [Fimicolochytrium jonesii]KAI8824360.1 chloride channel [Fimicolochytrium jonesii]